MGKHRMSKELENFQRTVKNAQLLILTMNAFDDIKEDLEKELEREKATPGSMYDTYKIGDIRKELINAVLTSQIALLQSSLEGYSIASSGGHKDMSSSCIRQHAPFFTLKVDPQSQEYHVTTIAKDIRDKQLHSLPDPYNTINTTLMPMEILAQQLIVEEYPDKKIVHFLAPGQSPAAYLAEKLNQSIADGTFDPVSHNSVVRSIRYINLLEEEILNCVKANDDLRMPSGGYKKTIMDKADHIPITYV